MYGIPWVYISCVTLTAPRDERTGSLGSFILQQPLVEPVADGVPEALQDPTMAPSLQAQRILGCNK